MRRLWFTSVASALERDETLALRRDRISHIDGYETMLHITAMLLLGLALGMSTGMIRSIVKTQMHIRSPDRGDAVTDEHDGTARSGRVTFLHFIHRTGILQYPN